MMKQRKRTLHLLLIFTAVFCAASGFFSMTVCAENTPAVEVQIEENAVYVNGTWNANKDMTILVKSMSDKIVYIDQETSDVAGKFSFAFLFPEHAENGTYLVCVGGEDVDTLFQTSIEYISAVPQVSTQISENCVSVNGFLHTGKGKQVTILVRDPFDKIVYVDQEETKEKGEFNFVFLLPPTAVNGVYTAYVGGEDITVPYNTSFTFSAARKPIEISVEGDCVEVTGRLQTEGEETVTILVRSPKGNIAYIDQDETDKNGFYSFAFIIPPLFSNGEYTVNVGGENLLTPHSETFMYTAGVPGSEKAVTLNIKADKETTLHIQGQNMRHLENKDFTLIYDTKALGVTDLCVYTYEAEKEAGQMGHTHIFVTESDEEKGIIRFRLNIQNGETAWDGAMSGFRFVGKRNGNTSVRLITEGGK